MRRLPHCGSKLARHRSQVPLAPSYLPVTDSVVVARHRATALHLLRTIVPGQRWGVARVRPDGWRLYLKGGWGSGPGLVDHQVALLRAGSHRVAVAVLTTGNPGHAYGQQTLRGVFARLLRGLAAREVLVPT